MTIQPGDGGIKCGRRLMQIIAVICINPVSPVLFKPQVNTDYHAVYSDGIYRRLHLGGQRISFSAVVFKPRHMQPQRWTNFTRMGMYQRCNELQHHQKNDQKFA